MQAGCDATLPPFISICVVPRSSSHTSPRLLGPLRQFWGVLGAALGIQKRKVIVRIRNSILGMASHNLSNTKTTVLGATPRVIPQMDGKPHKRFSFAPCILGASFSINWGGPRAPEILSKMQIPSDVFRQCGQGKSPSCALPAKLSSQQEDALRGGVAGWRQARQHDENAGVLVIDSDTSNNNTWKDKHRNHSYIPMVFKDSQLNDSKCLRYLLIC